MNQSRATPAAAAAIPVAMASAAVIATKWPLPCVANSPTVAADSAAVADIGPDGEMPGASGRRIEEQRRRRRVEADHAGDRGDRGIGERLGDQHRPHGQAGHDVDAEPVAPIPPQGA